MPPLSPKPSVSSDLRSLDTHFRHAGLVRICAARNGRSESASTSRPARFERYLQDELQQSAPVPRVASNGVQWLPVPGWEKIGWLWHGFSTRKGGVSRAYCAESAPGELNLGFTAADDRAAVSKNRSLFVEAITGVATTPLITMRQVHSSVIVAAGEQGADRQQPCKGDGLITNEPGKLLAIQTADCIPVLVADRKRRVVAAFHAGWRGTVKRIVEAGVGRMRLQYGSRPEDLVAAIGPGIGVCCYAVGEEVLLSFESQFTYARELFLEVYDTDPVRTKYPMLFLTQRAPGHSNLGPSLHLNLVEANRRQLLAAGLKSRAIQVIGGCTSCERDLFFSHRASQGHAGRMMSVIGIRLARSKNGK
jgi:YfiH family protein